MAAHTESVNLGHFEGPVGDLPASLAKRRAFYVDICRYATSVDTGQARATAIACKKRPHRRPCPGFLDVRCQDLPRGVAWRCPACGTEGWITGWEDGDADLRDVEIEADDADRSFVVGVAEHAALRQLARENQALIPVAFRADRDDGAIVLRMTEEEQSEVSEQLLEGSLRAGPGRHGDRLCKLAELLAGSGDSEGSGVVDLAERTGVSPAALFELLSQLEDLAPPQFNPVHRSRPRRSARTRTFRIKVTLRHVRPPVWRRLLVPSDIPLPRLHQIIQAAMGWYDCHLHLFRQGARAYAPASPDFDPIGEDSSKLVLSDLVSGAKKRLVYEYDFGDGWEHDLVVEEVFDEVCARVRCLGGRRRCPPEDCGGPAGYAHLRAARTRSSPHADEEYGEALEADFDPEEFDLVGTDALLQRIGPGVARR